MKKKILIVSGISVVLIAILGIINFYLSLILFTLFILTILCGACILILNSLYKKTYHWKNQFAFQKHFVSNQGYRENISRNYDIVNLGSNPALFGFFYEKIRGQNWATGSQGLPMDFEILKYFHSYIKEGGIVLIPIMPFTSISQYLKTKPNYWSDKYYIKFTSILDSYQSMHLNNSGKNYFRMLKYPILYNPKLIIYIFHDVEKDRNLDISEQYMQALELEQDARKWVYGWMQEFDVSSMEEFYGSKFHPYMEEGIGILREMIDFCLERSLRPVLITLPMSSYLNCKFDNQFRERMVKDFVTAANLKNIPFLDYWDKNVMTDSSLYMNSFFFNLRGRKKFTEMVLNDIMSIYL